MSGISRTRLVSDKNAFLLRGVKDRYLRYDPVEDALVPKPEAFLLSKADLDAEDPRGLSVYYAGMSTDKSDLRQLLSDYISVGSFIACCFITLVMKLRIVPKQDYPGALIVGLPRNQEAAIDATPEEIEAARVRAEEMLEASWVVVYGPPEKLIEKKKAEYLRQNPVQA